MMVRIFTRIVRIDNRINYQFSHKDIIRISELIVRKETGLARMVMVIVIVRLVMRVVRMVIMKVGRGIIMAKISYKFGHLES